jgi:GNAT superfamily N-acetyltransferase
VDGAIEHAVSPKSTASDRLAGILADAAAGRFPPADGNVTILPQPSERDSGVISFTAHAVIFTAADPGWVAKQLPPDDLSGPLSPSFLVALGTHTGRTARNIDILTCATPLPGPPPAELSPVSGRQHARVARALHYRDDVRVWQAAGGVVIVGRGVAGRWEVAIEVDPGHRGRGLGRELASAARHLAPGPAPLWAQIAPGNAASVRAFLAAGYRPVGAEVLLTRGLPD